MFVLAARCSALSFTFIGLHLFRVLIPCSPRVSPRWLDICCVKVLRKKKTTIKKHGTKDPFWFLTSVDRRHFYLGELESGNQGKSQKKVRTMPCLLMPSWKLVYAAISPNANKKYKLLSLLFINVFVFLWLFLFADGDCVPGASSSICLCLSPSV